MKPLLLLCLIIPFFYLPFFSVKAKTQSYSVKVTAWVPTHLTYIADNKNLVVSTNYPTGFILLTHEKMNKMEGPAEHAFQINEPFLVIVNY